MLLLRMSAYQRAASICKGTVTKGLAGLFLLLRALPSQAQPIPAAGLRADAALLRTALESLHPGLYRYNSKQQMDAHFAALNRRFESDLSLDGTFLALTAFTAQIRCGHTYPNFFNQKKQVAEALFQGQNRLPFYFTWLDNRMVVTEDLTPDQSLPPGTEILSINGVATRKILERMMPLARADGANDAKRRSYLEVNGGSRYEAFDVLYPLLFPLTAPRFQLECKRPQQKRPAVLFATALDAAQRVTPRQSRELGVFEWRFLPNGNAYLRMPTWSLYNSKWDWKAWLNLKLDELAERNPQALVIDLRGNEGGLDVGDEILKRIAPRDLPAPAYTRLVRYRQTEAPLNPHLDTWDNSFRDWKDDAIILAKPWPTAPATRYYQLTRFDEDKILHPAGKPFRGSVYLLTDSSNSSATFQFAQIVQKNKLGLLVGQPTGGNQRGINGGAFFFLRLPNSGIEIDIPLIGTFPQTPQPDAGLKPDIAVKPTLASIAAGTDLYLSAVTSSARATDSTAAPGPAARQPSPSR